MTQHQDLLDQPEPLTKWLLGSVVLHATLTVSLLAFNVIGLHKFQLGDPHGGGFGSVQVNTVHNINLPSPPGPTNPVASDTKSAIPTAPPAKAKPKPKVQAPDPNAIALKSRQAEKEKKRPAPAYAERNKFVDARKDAPNQAYTTVPQAVSNPMYQMQGGGGVGVGNNSPFGTMYGEYANRLRDQVARNWRTSGIPQQAANAPMAAVTFMLHRDGSVTSVRITGKSGNAALDYSAQRAILDAAPFPPLPAGFPRDNPEIEFLFELKR